MTILIADDEISITSLLGDYFSPKYDVLIAKDGSQAYDIFKSHIDEINLCIFDYMMPAINGIELCKMVKSIKRLPVIIFTAKTEDEIQLLAFDNSADEYISISACAFGVNFLPFSSMFPAFWAILRAWSLIRS